MIEAVLVDDENKAREYLTNIISKNCPNIRIIGYASNAEEGFQIIDELKPSLVFLDVEMPGGNGFDMLERFDSVNFDVIFTTAYDHYAIKAIEYSAIGYLMKPISKDRLTEAVEKVNARKANQVTLDSSIELLLSNLKTDSVPQRIAIPDSKGLSFVNIDDIVRCQSAGNYCILHLVEGRTVTSTKTLKEFEDLLDGKVFCRVHQSSVINMNFLKRYERGEGGVAILEDGSEVEVSRRRKMQFLEILESIQKT